MGRGRPPFVKVCGLTSVGDLRAAEALGAQYVGLIVEVRRSPRSLKREQARLMARAARARAVLVTTATEAEAVAEVAGFVRPAVVQLHGSAGTALIEELRISLEGVEIWHVVPLPVEGDRPSRAEAQLRAEVQAAIAAGADKLLIDSARGGHAGGTGVPADWETAAALVELAGGTPVILAGGLGPANVAEAVRCVAPAGVDVSSGVESAPGLKSPRLIRDFFRAVTLLT